MSIVLKTDPKDFGGFYAPGSPLSHDALAAHAMQMAIEEARIKWKAQAGQYDWIDARAAANLARLMGEGNG